MLIAAILIPLFGATLAWRSAGRARTLSLGAALLSFLAALACLSQVLNHGRVALFSFTADAVNAMPLVVFAALSLAVIALLPERDASPRAFAEILLMLSATLAAYSSEHLVLLWFAWLAASLPMLLNRETPPSSRVVVLVSVVALGAAVLVISGDGSIDLSTLRSLPPGRGGAWGFGLIALAIFLRKGIFPLHSWPANAFEKGPFSRAALLVNGHLGAVLLARVGAPLFPAITRESFPMLSDLALFTAALTALAALAEKVPRRLLGLVLVSHASMVLAGLESLTPEGISGALVYLMVVSVSTTGLAAIYQALEVRVDRLSERTGFLGLGNVAPRLSVFFVVCAFALVGLPGTLGFAAEDLLLHGTLETHPWIGLALPLATALNALTLFRLFARLFMGRPILPATTDLDALPRERWALGAVLLFLIAGGLLPSQFVKLDATAADAIVSALHQSVARR